MRKQVTNLAFKKMCYVVEDGG
eukprot:SAG11_NODE_21131_length_431_cov_1.388554_2_plen_21_part_01